MRRFVFTLLLPLVLLLLTVWEMKQSIKFDFVCIDSHLSFFSAATLQSLFSEKRKTGLETLTISKPVMAVLNVL